MSEVKLFGLDGKLHHYPEWFYLLLKGVNKRLVRSGAPGILFRIPKSDHQRIHPRVIIVLRPILEDLPNYSPFRKLHAFDPTFENGTPRRCGRRPLIDLLECGIDDRVAHRDAECAAEMMDRTPFPGRDRLRDEETDRIVRDVMMRRVAGSN